MKYTNQEIHERLSDVEKLLEKDQKTLDVILRIIKGDEEINGVGLMQRMRELEEIVGSLKNNINNINVEIRKTIREELFMNKSRPAMIGFTSLPLYQKILVIIGIISFFGFNIVAMLRFFFEQLEKFVK